MATREWNICENCFIEHVKGERFCDECGGYLTGVTMYKEDWALHGMEIAEKGFASFYKETRPFFNTVKGLTNGL